MGSSISAMPSAAYAELQTTSNFCFLRGASHPEELVERAKDLGLKAISVTDRNSFAGIVRAHIKAKELDVRFIPGCRLDLTDAPSLLIWPTNRPAYAKLSSLLTEGKRRTEKGQCHLTLQDVADTISDHLIAVIPPKDPDPPFAEWLSTLASQWGDRLHLTASHFYSGDDHCPHQDHLADLAQKHRCTPAGHRRYPLP